MRSVICPLCRQGLYSETFRVGEQFRCPHCERELVVESFQDEPKVRLLRDPIESGGLAEGLWRDNRLFLTPPKLAVLGEALVAGLGMDEWSRQTTEQLEIKCKGWEKAEKVLCGEGIDAHFFALGRTLLDCYLTMRRAGKP